MKQLVVTLVLAIATAIGLQTAAQPSEPDRVAYRETPQGTLHLQVHRPPADADGDTPAARPALVLFHGGGWVRGRPESLQPIARHLADRGTTVISVQYRLIGEHRQLTPFDLFDDARAAHRFVVDHAADLRIDPQRIALGGGSAGGHLATALVAFGDDDLPPAAALVLLNPAFDLSDTGWQSGRRKVQAAGADPLAFSPAHHVHADFPPTLIIHGSEDRVTPLANARDFQQRMRQAGVTCDLIAFPDRGHGFFNGEDRGIVLEHIDHFLNAQRLN
jgi:acetyl esterase/lipase